MFIAYLWNNDSAARCLIAMVLGGIYILVWVYFFFETFLSYIKIMLVSQPSFAMLREHYVSGENDAIGEFGCIFWHN